MTSDNYPDEIHQSLPGGPILKRVGATEPAAYAVSEGAPQGVPTGRVLVRFDENLKFQEQAALLAGAGFLIEEPLAHAPHAGWVRPNSHSAADALREMHRLAGLPGVRHVEPQLLYDRAFKD